MTPKRAALECKGHIYVAPRKWWKLGSYLSESHECQTLQVTEWDFLIRHLSYSVKYMFHILFQHSLSFHACVVIFFWNFGPAPFCHRWSSWGLGGLGSSEMQVETLHKATKLRKRQRPRGTSGFPPLYVLAIWWFLQHGLTFSTRNQTFCIVLQWQSMRFIGIYHGLSWFILFHASYY